MTNPSGVDALSASPAGRQDVLRKTHALLRTVVRTYHRAEAMGVANVPASGGALLVSNHSGGMLSMDVPVIASAVWDEFGVARDLRVLAHDAVMWGPIGRALSAVGCLAANPANADAALREGAAVIVFPGGDWDACRPTANANVVDFGGRTGYLRTALAADVPVVPVVSIGAHETQLILTRGEAIARVVPLLKKLRSTVAPIAVGIPFGVTLGFPQFPLPSKIVTQFLEPVHLREEFGSEPDLHEVDAVIRDRMQRALDAMASARRFPVIG
jgi:1-acyl-sn-glycerol-3-phosphate acyltransferase